MALKIDVRRLSHKRTGLPTQSATVRARMARARSARGIFPGFVPLESRVNPTSIGMHP